MNAKKIVGFIVVSIIAIICIFVIASAIVPKNFSFDFDAPSSIKILNAKNGDEVIEKTNKKYDEIIDLFNSGFKVNFLEAFFQGKGFNNVTTIKEYKALSSSNLSSSDALYIEFLYDNAQEVNLHGDEALEIAESDKTYKSVVLEIKKSNNLIQITAYLKSDASNSFSNVRYVSYAKQSELYDYLTENFEFNS